MNRLERAVLERLCRPGCFSAEVLAEAWVNPQQTSEFRLSRQTESTLSRFHQDIDLFGSRIVSHLSRRALDGLPGFGNGPTETWRSSLRGCPSNFVSQDPPPPHPPHGHPSTRVAGAVGELHGWRRDRPGAER